MKPIFLLLLLTILLSACAPAPTATVGPAPTVTPKPPDTPLPPAIATAIPTPTTESPSRNALLGLGYTDAELKVYETIFEGTYSFPGDTVIYNGIIGTKADGTKEIFAFKFSDNPNYIKLSSMVIHEKIQKLGSANYYDSGEGGTGKLIGTNFNAISTDIVETFTKTTASGETVDFDTLMFITLSEDGFPRLLRQVIQARSSTAPDQDLYENIYLERYGLKSERSTSTLSIEELKSFFSNNEKKVKLGLHFTISPNAIVRGSILFRETFGSDQQYLENVSLFITTHGKNFPSSDPLIISVKTASLIE